MKKALVTIGCVVISWLEVYGRFIRDATVFGYRVLTNKIGLPRWLWLLMLLAWLFCVGVFLITGK